MEEIIKKNRKFLCQNTTVNEDLLVNLVDSEIILESLKDSIKNMSSNLEKASALYEFLKRSVPDNKIEEVKEALQDSGNTKALEIFKKAQVSSSIEQDKSPVEKNVQESAPLHEATKSSSLLLNTNTNQQGGVLNATTSDTISEINNVYNNNGLKKALIINILDERPGAKHDSDALDDTLKKCGFEVQHCDKLTTDGIQETIQKFKLEMELAEKNGNVVCVCLVAVMGHGSGYDWFTTQQNGQLSIDKHIVEQFNYSNLFAEYPKKEIPKIFLINVCRGDQVDRPAVQTDSTSAIVEKYDMKQQRELEQDIYLTSRPTNSDLLICYASFKDHVAYREQHGTWFIQTFCKVIQENANRLADIRDICDMVSTHIGDKEAPGGYKQSPTYNNTGFRKKFYFKFENPNAATSLSESAPELLFKASTNWNAVKIIESNIENFRSANKTTETIPLAKSNDSTIMSGAANDATKYPFPDVKQVKSHELARLIKDDDKVNDYWKDISAEMKISAGDLRSLNKIERNDPFLEVLKKMITMWVSSTGADVTISMLTTILDKCECSAASGIIKKYYKPDTIILQ